MITGNHQVKLFTYFTCCNWQKNAQIVNELKTYTGEYIKLENPDLVDSDKILECAKVFALEPKLTEADQAIEMVKRYYLTKDGLGKSSEPIEKAIKWSCDLLTKTEKTWVKYYGWRAESIAEKAGVFNISFDLEFGVDIENVNNRVPTKKTVMFECDLNTKQVRCRNKMAANTAWVPDY